MACFETGVVSHSSLGLEKQIRPGWGPVGGWEAGGGWTPEVDAAGLPLPRTPHPDNGPPCSHSDRGWSEREEGKNTARMNWYAYFSSLVIVGAANQLVMFFRKRRTKSGDRNLPVPLSKMYDYTVAYDLILSKGGTNVGYLKRQSVLFFYFSTLYLSGNW